MRRPKSVRRRRLRRIWTQLRKELTRQVSHQPETWSRLRRYAPALASFGDPVGLLAWFRDPLGDRERKNVAYRQLLDADGRDQAARALARNIAWLGLWPALDRFVRRDERSGHDPATVAADYSFAFLTVVERFDGSRVNRVAATIVMNTARVVARAAESADASDRSRRPRGTDLACRARTRRHGVRDIDSPKGTANRRRRRRGLHHPVGRRRNDLRRNRRAYEHARGDRQQAAVARHAPSATATLARRRLAVRFMRGKRLLFLCET